MKFKQRDEYAINAEALFKAITDAAYLQARSEAIGARNISVEVSESGGAITAKVVREMPTDAPGKLKSFVPSWSKAVQTEQWKTGGGATYVGSADVHPDGVPATITSTMRIVPSGSGCVMEIDTEVKSSIPFVGGALAKFVGETAQKTLAAEYAYNQKNIG